MVAICIYQGGHIRELRKDANYFLTTSVCQLIFARANKDNRSDLPGSFVLHTLLLAFFAYGRGSVKS